MKILINASSARRGGGQTYLINLLRYIPQDPDLEIILLAPDSIEFPEEGERFSRLKVDWNLDNPFIRAFWERFVLPGLLRRMAVDVLFCPGGIIGSRVPAGCSTVTMSRNMMPFDLVQRKKYPLGYMRLRNWLLQRIMLRSMQRADLVIFISEYARKVVQSFSRTPIAHVEVIPHGINPLFIPDKQRSHPRPAWMPDGDYLLYVSILDVYKAQLEVVRGYAMARSKRSDLPRLVLIGPDDSPYGESVHREVALLGLEKEVLVLGAKPYHELPGAYAHARVNFFASECENCPNILLEAMAAGRPLLVSERQPMPEFGGDAAVYFNPSEPQNFADKLQVVLDNPVLQDEMAGKARIRSELYSWEKTAGRTWQALLGMVKSVKG